MTDALRKMIVPPRLMVREIDSRNNTAVRQYCCSFTTFLLTQPFYDTLDYPPLFDSRLRHGRCLSPFLIRFLTHELRVKYAIRLLRIGSAFHQLGWSERIDKSRERKFEPFSRALNLLDSLNSGSMCRGEVSWLDVSRHANSESN